MYVQMPTSPSPMLPFDPWFSLAEVAEVLGLSVSETYAVILSGPLVGYRIGGEVSVKSTDLDAYLELMAVAA